MFVPGYPKVDEKFLRLLGKPVAPNLPNFFRGFCLLIEGTSVCLLNFKVNSREIVYNYRQHVDPEWFS